MANNAIAKDKPAIKMRLILRLELSLCTLRLFGDASWFVFLKGMNGLFILANGHYESIHGL